MGSSFTIVNDTDHEVWMDISVNYKALIPAVGGLLALFTAGAGLAAYGASAGVGVLLGGGAMIATETGIIMGTTASTIAGLSAGTWTMIEVVGALSTLGLSTFLNISQSDAQNLKNRVREFKNGAHRLVPGQRYSYNASLSFHMRVTLMNDMLQVDDRACWTGPTDKSNIDYPISQYFTNLEVRKTKFSTITVKQKQNIAPIYHQKMVFEPIKPKYSTHKIASKPPKPSKPNVKKGSSKQKKNDHKSKQKSKNHDLDKTKSSRSHSKAHNSHKDRQNSHMKKDSSRQKKDAHQKSKKSLQPKKEIGPKGHKDHKEHKDHKGHDSKKTKSSRSHSKAK